ncbi:MAG: diguanylate cyclase [Sulfurimonas sp.]|jgi:diguanylate cyclase (GGDEF)-like protein|nr:diguanylate cyclase [Sulfurimonas sp.]
MKYLLTLLLLASTHLFSNEKVTLQLKWFHQFQFAGYYVAKEMGYYKDVGLDVEIKERDIRYDNIEQVLSGEAQFGVADAVLFLYLAKGSPIKIIAPIMQHSPNMLITLKSSGLNSPYKLHGKKLRFYGKDTDGFSILAMLKSVNVQPTLERLRNKDDIYLLAKGEIDAITAYIANEPFLLKEMGVPYNVINPAHYGLDLYGDMLFTSQEEAAKHPKRVERFKQATLKGWEYALKNKELVARMIYEKYSSHKSLEHLLYEAKVLEQFIRHESIPLGTFDTGRVQYTLDLYKKHKLIKESAPLGSYIFEPYKQELKLTTQEQYYLAQKGEIHLCIDPNWMPFESNADGEHIGMSAEYFKLLEQKLEIPIKMIPTSTWAESLEYGKARKCDIFSLVMPTKERREYLDFTQNYLSIPLVITTRLDELFVEKIEHLEGKKVGIVEGYAYGEILRERYPLIDIVDVKNIIEGLEKVKNGELFGFIDTLATTGYEIQKNYVGELKIAGKFDDRWELGIGTRNDEPLLQSIFNKAISTLDAKTHQEILNKWVSVNYAQESSQKYRKPLLWTFGLLVVLSSVLFIIVRTNAKLQEEIRGRRETQKQLQEQLKLIEKLSITDELTSLYNRRHFNDVLTREFSRAKREKQPIAFLMFDVDFFKDYNDTYGHQKGDMALKEIGRLLNHFSKRGSDFAFRLGGEEFGLIYSEKSFEEALAFAQKLREEIEDLGILHSSSSISDVLTISIGLVYFASVEEINENSIYKQVDENLYKAKESGRNRVIASYNS